MLTPTPGLRLDQEQVSRNIREWVKIVQLSNYWECKILIEIYSTRNIADGLLRLIRRLIVFIKVKHSSSSLNSTIGILSTRHRWRSSDEIFPSTSEIRNIFAELIIIIVNIYIFQAHLQQWSYLLINPLRRLDARAVGARRLSLDHVNAVQSREEGAAARRSRLHPNMQF